MKHLKFVFWDVDGTLADTEMSGHRIAFNNAFHDFNLDWDWDIATYTGLLRIQGGVNRILSYAHSKCIDLDSRKAQSVHSLKQNYYHQQVINGNVPLRKGVKRLNEELTNLGIDQWIVTTSSSKAVNSLITTLFNQNTSAFQGAITFEDVDLHKPNPEAYLKAMKASGATKNNTIVIEDSIPGLFSAKSAILKCILTIPSWSQRISPDMLIANAVLDHLGEPDSPCRSLQGLSCKPPIVSAQYLESILNEEE